MKLESDQWVRIIICAILFTPVVGAIVWAVYQYEAIQQTPKAGLPTDSPLKQD